MSIADTNLFIGGPWDGRRVATEPRLDILRIDPTRGFYHRQLIDGDGIIFAVWRWGEMTNAEAMAALFAKYPEMP